jgi:hypothetical protein
MNKTSWSPHALDAAEDARNVLRNLLTGRDPVCGKPLPKGSCLAAARVWRALFVALVQLGEGSTGADARPRVTVRRSVKRTGRSALATGGTFFIPAWSAVAASRIMRCSVVAAVYDSRSLPAPFSDRLA